MRTEFSAANTEGDVELFFIMPLLTRPDMLDIPETAIRSKESLAAFDIDKGRTRKRYVPDFVIYCEGLPILVIEAKSPEEKLDDAFAEAQLYASELNKQLPSGVNPAQFVIATNGNDIYIGRFDQGKPAHRFSTPALKIGLAPLSQLVSYVGWNQIQANAAKYAAKYLPTDWHLPSEQLGENRVTLAKAGHNSLYEELDPILRRFFNPRDKENEDEIIRLAYVTSEEKTRYERTFEDFLRTRVVPNSDPLAEEIETSRRDAPGFSKRLDSLTKKGQPYMQLIIGGVGSGKTSFIKRYFNYMISEDLRRRIVYCRMNFNEASDDLQDVKKWVCERFVETIRDHFGDVINLETEQGLMSVFAKEIKDRQGAYSLLKKGSIAKFNERLASDMLDWMQDPELFAKSLARAISGDRNLSLIVAFDNVDRRERESQLRIFQTGQWFMALTKSVCIMTLRDETFEQYKDEKPLDAFLKTSNFYIRPPRFIDMVSKRLDVVLGYLEKIGTKTYTYEVEGLGKVKYPATSLGSYLTSVYVDLFRKKRNITLILEGLSGKNARRALEMFGAVLTSAHFDTRAFTSAALTDGTNRIHETVLLRALMRTNYLYFKPSHGFVRNIYDFPLDVKAPNHFLKFELLKFLVENRKKQGDTRYEGYFTVSYLINLFGGQGFVAGDVESAINCLIADELILSEDLTYAPVKASSAVRVRASGYVHFRILAQRTEYIAACALITPVADAKVAARIGRGWQISDPNLDIKSQSKSVVAHTFVEYLEDQIEERRGSTVGVEAQERIGSQLVRFGREALSFQGDKGPEKDASQSEEKEFDRLFAE